MKPTSLKSIPLTHPQAAQYLGIGRTALCRLADTGKIPYTTGSQGARRYRVYRVDDLKAYRDAMPVPKSPPSPTTPPDGYVDTQTAATLMGISTSGVSKAFAAGRLPKSIKPGKFRFYAKTDIDRFVKVPSDQGLLDLNPVAPSIEDPRAVIRELRVLNTNVHELLTLARGQNFLLTTLVEKWS